MAIQFIKSIDIQVFPAVHRATAYAISKRTTEDNLTKFGKLSSNKANLSQMFEDPDDDLYVIFNIAGYWFRCLKTNIPGGDNLYAYIKLTYNANIGYMLSPIGVGSTLLDVGTAGNEDFKGLAFTEDGVPTNGVDVVYYGLKIKNGSVLTFQNLKLDASEIRNTAGDDDTKHIGEEFDTGTLTVAGKTTINSTTDSTSSATGALVLAGGAAIAKKLYVGTDLDVNGKTTLDSTDIDVETAGKFDIVNGATVIESTNKDNKSLNVPIITDVTIQNGASGASTFKVAKTTGVEVGTDAIAKTTKLYGDTTAYHGTTQAFKVDVDSGIEVGTSASAKTTKLYGDTTIYNASSAVINVDVDATSGTAGLTIAKTAAITDTSDATNAESGALRVSGGVGIAKNLFVDGNTTLGDTATADTTTINGVTTINGHTSANTKTLVIKNGNNEKFSVDSDGDVLATTYNSLTLTAGGSGFSVSGGTASKKLTLSDDTTLATNALTLKSGKALTMQYAGLTVGDSYGTGTVTIKTSDATERNLTLTGSPSLSAITTTGSGILALNKNLTINDADKTFAGAGTSLTIDNSLDIAGTTAQITLGTDAHTLAFTTTAATNVTLPTEGTLYGTKQSSMTANQLFSSLTTAGTDKTGTGAVVFGTAPTFTTSIIAPTIYGSATTANNLNLQPNSANATTGSVIINSTSASTNMTSGSLIVKGGAAIAGALNVGGRVNINGTITGDSDILNLKAANNDDNYIELDSRDDREPTISMHARYINIDAGSDVTVPSAIFIGQPSIADNGSSHFYLYNKKGTTGKTTKIQATQTGQNNVVVTLPTSDATLIGGTYTTSANTNNSENAVEGTLVKRTNDGSIKATSFIGNTSFTNNFDGGVSIPSSGNVSVPGLEWGKTYQIHILCDADMTASYSLGLVTIPNFPAGIVFTACSGGALSYYLEISNTSGVTCWQKSTGSTTTKTACYLYYKLIS